MSVLNHVPRVPLCLKCLMCQHALRTYVLTCLTCLRAFVLLPFTCLPFLRCVTCLTCFHFLRALRVFIFFWSPRFLRVSLALIFYMPYVPSFLLRALVFSRTSLTLLFYMPYVPYLPSFFNVPDVPFMFLRNLLNCVPYLTMC